MRNVIYLRTSAECGHDTMNAEKVKEIRQAFFEYANKKVLSVFITHNYFAK
jgi:hypothetical protein